MTCNHSLRHSVPSLNVDCAYCQKPGRGPNEWVGLSYALAKHTGENMIFPYWELDQDRRCQSLTDEWSGYRSPIST